jgi:predicted small lipoprotein YifL
LPVIKEPAVSASRSLSGLAVIALLAALTLAGCGRKGPLDPPPAAAVTGEQAAPTGDKSAPATDKSAAIGPDGKPIAPSAPNKRFFLDGLLN